MAGEKQVILFPFMAQSFIIPFMALAKLIAKQSSYTVTFVSTPLNIPRLKASVLPSSTIQFAALPFDSAEHGLPPATENVDSMTPSLAFTFQLASQSLRPAFEHFLSDMSIKHGRHRLCVVTDFLLGWVVTATNKFGIYSAVFDPSPACGSAVEFSLWLNMPHRTTDADEFLLPDFPEAGPISRTQVPYYILERDHSDPMACHWRRQLEAIFRADRFLFNTVAVLDEPGLDHFSRKMGKSCLAIGPICSESEESRPGKGYGLPVSRCVEWLDRHPPLSVLYIAFGSWNTISGSQMMALAKGLEASGRPFLWAIRPPTGHDINGEIRPDWLPDDFETRMADKGQGILVRKWSPQLAILSHRSVGAFLSHCGWSSTLESLTNGVPIIGWPVAAEQFYNSKMLVEQLGVAVEIARGGEWEIDCRHVVNVIDLVWNSEIGEKMRDKAQQVKEVMKSAIRNEKDFVGPSVRALDEFLTTAFCTKKIMEEL